MSLNHDQKRYIKKNIKKQSIDQIAIFLKIDKKDLEEYIKKRWGEERLQSFTLKSTQMEIEKPKQVHQWYEKKWVHILALTILILITYLNSLNNAFVSDDIAEIRDNPNTGNISNILTHPFGFIRLTIYWLSYHLGGGQPFVFRLTNLVFHLGASILIYLILLKISRSKKIAFFTAAFFAVHPAIAEAVVWISGGMYAQYTFFFLLSFFFYILSKNNLKFYLLSIVSYLLSFMSHPVMPAGLAVIFLFYEFCFGSLKKNWAKSIPFFLILAIYILINMGGLSERTATLQNMHYQERGIDNILILIPTALSSYFELLFWPKTLTLYHSELFLLPFTFAIRVIVSAIFCLLILYGLLKRKFIFFWLSFFFIALSPTLTPFRLNWIVAERYIYLPSLGIFAAIAFALNKLTQFRKSLALPIYIIFALVIIALSARTIIRNIDWKNEDNLWIATGKTSPSSPNTHNNLGDVYGRWGDKQRALQEFQTAIMLKPNYADAYHNLGNVYRELGQIDKAIESYTKAAEINPNLWQSHQNLAAIYFSQQKYDLALENMQKAVLINPKNLNLYNNMGILYLSMGNKEKAREVFSNVLSADPQNLVAKQGFMEASK